METSQQQKMRLRAFCKKIKANEWESERWLYHQWVHRGLKDKTDRWNRIVGKYIVDLINRKYGYIIEVDGSIHDRPEQKLKDQIKDKYLTTKGFKVFRIKAFDMQSLFKTISNIKYIQYQFKNRKLDENSRPILRPPKNKINV